MVYRHRKPGLYEIISKDRAEKGSKSLVDPLRPKKVEESGEVFFDDKTHEKPLEWAKKRRLVWMSNNRVEISVSYPLAVAIVLGVVLLLLLAFRLGRLS